LSTAAIKGETAAAASVKDVLDFEVPFGKKALEIAAENMNYQIKRK
jgi:hypothetical protein